MSEAHPLAMAIEGVYSVLPTPFAADGSLDLASLRRVVDLYLAAGVRGLTVLGVTGEVARLSERERAQVLETVLTHVQGRLPVVAGTTAGGLHACIQASREAKAAGAAAVMVAPPRLAKLNSGAVLAHFAELAAAVDVEIVVQDYPPATGFTMEPSLLARIARELPRARTIKLEDAPTPLKTAQVLQCAEVPVRIIGGLGGMYLLEELMAGAEGAMTGFAYPEVLVAIVRAFKDGDTERAADLFYRYVPLMRFEFQEGIGVAIRKEILRRRGALAQATVRAPGAGLAASTREQLDRLLGWLQDRYDADGWIKAHA